MDSSTQTVVGLEQFSLHDIESIRLLLRGGSVVDWYRATFREAEEVKSFLHAGGLDLTRTKDRVRLHTVHRQAVAYLKDKLRFVFPSSLAQPETVVDVFLAASAANSTDQRAACSILKVMHIINHVEAQELRRRLSMPDRELFQRVEQRVVRAVDEMSRAGLGVHKFLPSVKEKSSVITKLLSKKRTLAAEIYDRIRFRIVIEDHASILPVIRFLLIRLFPFNYATPEESRNDVLDFRGIVESSPKLAQHVKDLQFPLQWEDRSHTGLAFNEFSARNYHTISFVVDIPLRVDTFMPPEGRLFEEFGPLVYVTTEFQIVDRQTALRNEMGEGSHDEYKRRQLNRVLYRLTHGLGPMTPLASRFR